MRVRSLVLLAPATIVACTAVDNAPAPEALAELDEAAFHCGVEPILARDCSYLGCHGLEGKPLRVYSVGKLRAGPHATLDERLAPLTDDERHANFRSAAGFSFGDVPVDDNLLVRKVLPACDGGYAHLGGAIFDGLDDPRTMAVRAWLSGGNPCPVPP